MRIAVFSDFHVSATRFDPFGHDMETFLHWMDEVTADHELVVFLGDLFQCQFGLTTSRWEERRELRRIARTNGAMLERLTDAKALLISGNHDAVTQEVLGAQEEFLCESDGVRCLFLHGHQFDVVMNGHHRVARVGTWVLGRLRHLGLGRIAEAIEQADVDLKAAWYKDALDPYQLAASLVAKAADLDLVCMGHTHVAGFYSLGEALLVNSGTCSHGRSMAVSIDTGRRSVRFLGESAPRIDSMVF